MIKGIIIFIALFYGLSAGISAQQVLVSGKVLNEHLSDFSGVSIVNLNSQTKVMTNEEGLFTIEANQGDSLSFSIIGVTTEYRVSKDPADAMHVILMDKSVNCLGSSWSDKQWRKAERRRNIYYRGLYRKAEKNKKWK